MKKTSLPTPIHFSSKEKWGLRILWILIGSYVVFYSLVCFLKYKFFIYNDFDLAIHVQVLWNILHGSLESSILGIDFLGNHAHFVLFLLAPLYKIAPHPLTILFIQTLALGCGAYPLYLLAKDVFGHVGLALALALSYLLYPGLGYTNLFEFHPPALATFFLLWMLFYFHRNRFWPFVLFMVLSMLCQENIPLAVIALGFYALVRRRTWRWILVPILAGAVYFWLVIAKIMPYFNRGTIQFISLYAHLGRSYGEILANMAKHPLIIFKIMFMKRKLLYLGELLAPVAFMPLISLSSLLIALPLFMQHLLSLRENELFIYNHYTAELIPFIFFAAIFGIKRLLGLSWLKKQGLWFGLVFAGISLGCNIYFGPFLQTFGQVKSLFPIDDTVPIKESFVRMVPSQASVVSTFEFLPHLANRKGLYSFHHVFMGSYTLSSQPYVLPHSVEYALIDFNDRMTFAGFYNPVHYENIERFLADGSWGAVAIKDSFVLFQKNGPHKFNLYKTLAEEPVPQHKTSALIGQEIEFKGFEVGALEGRSLHLSLYWHCLEKTDKDFNVFFDLFDADGITTFHFMKPLCFRIFPTQAWEAGTWIQDEQYLQLPSRIPPGKYILMMGFYDFRTGQIYPVNPQDPLGRVYISELSLT